MKPFLCRTLKIYRTRRPGHTVPLKCKDCAKRLGYTVVRIYRRCEECEALGRKLTALFKEWSDNTRSIRTPESEARVARYAKLVASGVRLFEATPTPSTTPLGKCRRTRRKGATS